MSKMNTKRNMNKKNLVETEENELLNPFELRSHSGNVRGYPTPRLGLPEAAYVLSWADYCLTLFSFLCFGLALMAVFATSVAVWLGQVNQLIVLGVLLQLMALSTQRQVPPFLLAVESLRNNSSLRNFDSIVRMNLLNHGTAWPLRAAIFLYISLPLGLGVAYKKFTGGVTSLAPFTDTHYYGLTGPPGTFGMGRAGTALFFNATLPWWNDPAPKGVYGFNVNIESDARTALLDGPVIGHVKSLQGMLQNDEILVLNSTVNATVAEMVIDLADSAREPDLALWYQNQTAASVSPLEATNDFWDTYGDNSNNVVVGSTSRYDIVIPTPPDNNWVWNNSFLMTSRWNASNGETFASAAQGFFLSRETYTASWFITPSSISLQTAEPVQGGLLTDAESISLIQHNYLSVQDNCARIYYELDWKFVPGHEKITSDTTIIAAMVWSRVAVADGPGYPGNNESSGYGANLIYPGLGLYQISTPTLKRSPILAIVLAINPVLLLTILVLRSIFLRDAPVSKNFGIISILGAIAPESLGLLKGASYSGKLDKDVRMRFIVASTDDRQELYDESGYAKNQRGKLSLKLEDMNDYGAYRHVRNDRLKMNVMYE